MSASLCVTPYTWSLDLGVFAFLCNVVHMCGESVALSCSCVLRARMFVSLFWKKVCEHAFRKHTGSGLRVEEFVCASPYPVMFD